MATGSTPPVRVCGVIGALTTGGSERQMLGILQHLDRAKFQPHLFTFYRDSPLANQVPADVLHFCYEQHCGPLKPGWLPGRIQRVLARSLAEYCIQHQIDVVYDRTYHVSLVTGAACRRSSVPYVSTVVENPAVGFYSTAGTFGFLKYHQLRKVYRQAAKVLCVSQGLVRGTAEFFRLPESTFSCCYNFVDANRMAAIEDASELRRRLAREWELQTGLGHADRPLRMVAVGRLHWQKGLDVLLRAIAKARTDHGLIGHLTLVGDGPDAERLRDLSRDLDLETVVQFVGWQSEPAQVVAQADVFVLPSLTEGLPNSLLEALLIGVPAIASDCNYGPAELTDGGRWATLVPPGDVAAWSQALLSFVKDPGAAYRRSEIARETLRRRFDPQVGCRQLEDHLLEAARR